MFARKSNAKNRARKGSIAQAYGRGSEVDACKDRREWQTNSKAGQIDKGLGPKCLAENPFGVFTSVAFDAGFALTNK